MIRYTKRESLSRKGCGVVPEISTLEWELPKTLCCALVLWCARIFSIRCEGELRMGGGSPLYTPATPVDLIVGRHYRSTLSKPPAFPGA